MQDCVRPDAKVMLLWPLDHDYKPIDNYITRREEQFQKRGPKWGSRFGGCNFTEYFISVNVCLLYLNTR